jgi:hypothetical protein
LQVAFGVVYLGAVVDDQKQGNSLMIAAVRTVSQFVDLVLLLVMMMMVYYSLLVT